MRTPLQRVYRGAIFLGLVCIASVTGYHYLSGQSWLESLYWFVITASSVGYTEDSVISPTLQAFSIVVLLVGMSAAIYTFGGFIQLMTEGEIDRVLGVRRMTREIQRVQDHVIICGFGRIGSILAHELTSHQQSVLIIDRDPQRIAAAAEAGYLVLLGDATEETVLKDAGIERAKYVVSGLPSDAENVFITLTCRNLNPQVQIISRGDQSSSEKKILQAGANRVVLTTVMGAHQIARMIMRPHTAQLIEQVSDHTQLEAELDEIRLDENSPLIGKTVAEAGMKRVHRLLIVAVARAGEKPVLNPDAQHVFQAGDTLIIMGHGDDITRFRTRAGAV